jgi:hypothetical protein
MPFPHIKSRRKQWTSILADTPELPKLNTAGKIWENHGKSYPEVNYQTIK